MEKVNNLTYYYEEHIITQYDIDEFTARHNVRLPKDFINHYLNHNGGWVNANWVDGDQEMVPFTHFLSIQYGMDTIDKAIDDIVEQQLGLGDRMPFAVNNIGGYFFIATDGEDFGRVFYAEIIPSEDGMKKLLDWKDISVNFTEFMKDFKVDDSFGKYLDPDLQCEIENLDEYIRENS